MNLLTTPAPYIISITPGGSLLGRRIAQKMPDAVFWVSFACHPNYPEAQRVDDLKLLFLEAFFGKHPLICIMATGIVVRHLAPLLKGKDSDPAVVVVDEAGRFAISLLSGHLGGANDLARLVGNLIGAMPVITTATDVQGLPALDALAPRLGLRLENLRAMKEVNMALLRGQRVRLVDPENRLGAELSDYQGLFELLPETDDFFLTVGPAVYVGFREYPWPEGWLRMRPKNLMAGMGCNKGTPAAEILELLEDTFSRCKLSLASLHTLATVDAKKAEPGFLAVAQSLGVNFTWYTKEELQKIPVPNPSAMVQRHLGVASVCEAAALKAAASRTLLVPKQKTANVTLAVAQAGWPWSV